MIRVLLLLAVTLGLMIAQPMSSGAQIADHLKCYKIKDGDLKKLKGLLNAETPQFGPESTCVVKKAALFCAPSTKEVLSLTNGDEEVVELPYSAAPAPGDFICYKIRCGKPVPPDQLATDQIGTRVLEFKSAQLLCAPAVKGSDYCGDGVIGGGEDCEPGDVGGQTCGGLGFAGGTLACAPGCTFDTGDCTPPIGPTCGDGTRNGYEQCDGSDLDGKTCLDFGFDGASGLACTDCTFDVSGCAACDPVVNPVTFDTSGAHSWVVPAGVTTISVDVLGGAGGDRDGGSQVGGLGGRVQADLPVTPGETVAVYVGGAGSSNSGSSGGAGGFNGGVQGGSNSPGSGGAGGGGASDIRIGGNSLADRVVVAGGGGGAAGADGGAGGGSSGSNGGDSVCFGATDLALGGAGGDQALGGVGGCCTEEAGSCFACGADGALGLGGAGADCFNGGGGGGGGGGYYGGGGGAGSSGQGAAGGGGSSLVPAGGTTTAGVQSGDGQVTISY